MGCKDGGVFLVFAFVICMLMSMMDHTTRCFFFWGGGLHEVSQPPCQIWVRVCATKLRISSKCIPFSFIFRLVYGCVSHKCHNFEICCHLGCWWWWWCHGCLRLLGSSTCSSLARSTTCVWKPTSWRRCRKKNFFCFNKIWEDPMVVKLEENN